MFWKATLARGPWSSVVIRGSRSVAGNSQGDFCTSDDFEAIFMLPSIGLMSFSVALIIPI